MMFCEPDTEVITLPKYENTFIYFLIRDSEVVYVGQTLHGITRPFAHRDKVFDEIKIIYCSAEDLDLFEDKYIQKYKPIYNKQSNYNIRWSLKRVRDCIRRETAQTDCTVPKLKKILKELNISPKKDCFNGKETITFNECASVIKHIKEKGKCNDGK